MKDNKQFGKWFWLKELSNEYPCILDTEEEPIYFEDLPWPFKWGVYLEFFDSQTDIDIEIVLDTYQSTVIGYIYTIRGCEYESKETRPEAQQAAITKAFEILHHDRQ
jgi:hypothetical protein